MNIKEVIQNLNKAKLCVKIREKYNNKCIDGPQDQGHKIALDTAKTSETICQREFKNRQKKDNKRAEYLDKKNADFINYANGKGITLKGPYQDPILDDTDALGSSGTCVQGVFGVHGPPPDRESEEYKNLIEAQKKLDLKKVGAADLKQYLSDDYLRFLKRSRPYSVVYKGKPNPSPQSKPKPKSQSKSKSKSKSKPKLPRNNNNNNNDNNGNTMLSLQSTYIPQYTLNEIHNTTRLVRGRRASRSKTKRKSNVQPKKKNNTSTHKKKKQNYSKKK